MSIFANNKNKHKHLSLFLSLDLTLSMTETYSQVRRVCFGVNTGWILISEPPLSNCVAWATLLDVSESWFLPLWKVVRWTLLGLNEII